MRRRHFRKLDKLGRFSLRDVTMTKLIGTKKLANKQINKSKERALIGQYLIYNLLVSEC